MTKKKAQELIRKNKEIWEEIAEEFSQTRVYPWEEFKNFLKYLKEGAEILDVGCGNGRLYDFLREKKINYIGLDSSEKLIGLAKQKYKMINSYPKFLVGDALNLPFESERFDLAFCIAVLHHFPKIFQRRVLSEIKRVLKRDGFLILTCWNLWQPKYFFSQLKKKFFNFKNFKDLEIKDFLIPWKFGEKIFNRYYYAFTLGELKRLLQKIGFKPIESYFSRKGKRANFLNCYNLVVISKKE